MCLASQKRGYDDKTTRFTRWFYKVPYKIPTIPVVTKMFLLPTSGNKKSLICVEYVSVSLLSTHIKFVGEYYIFACIEEL